MYSPLCTMLHHCSQIKKDILTETANHYKEAYSQKDTDSVDLSAIINNENFTKLTNGESLILDQPLQYGEYLPSLKKMSNHSSPGSSGFTVAFHKLFWIDIGHFLVRSLR